MEIVVYDMESLCVRVIPATLVLTVLLETSVETIIVNITLPVLLGKQTIPVTAKKVTWDNTAKIGITAPIILAKTQESVQIHPQLISASAGITSLGKLAANMTTVDGIVVVMAFAT